MLLAVVVALLAPAAWAQTSGGNLTQSGPYAVWEMYDAQNPPARNFEGCVQLEGDGYWLMPRKGKPLLLNFSEDQEMSGLEGAYVKLHGRENIGAGRRKDTTNVRFVGKEGRQSVMYTETIIEGEINVDRVTVLAESCPADWNKR
jgi:hypothetical protein